MAANSAHEARARPDPQLHTAWQALGSAAAAAFPSLEAWGWSWGRARLGQLVVWLFWGVWVHSAFALAVFVKRAVLRWNAGGV